MRKLFTCLLSLFTVVTGVHAQRHVDIRVDTILGLQSGMDYPCSGTQQSGYVFINNGPDTLYATDSLELIDPNIDNVTDPPASGSFYIYRVPPTGSLVNGITQVGNTYEYVPVDVAPGDTVLYYLWDDTITRLNSLLPYNNPVDTVNNQYNWVYQADGNVPANGQYLWLVQFLGFSDETTVVDTTTSNNLKVAAISINCSGTGVKDVAGNAIKLNVYPNPLNGSNLNFNFEFDKASKAVAYIKDISGRILISKEFGQQAPGNHIFSVDVSALASGTYFVELNADSKRAINQVVITR